MKGFSRSARLERTGSGSTVFRAGRGALASVAFRRAGPSLLLALRGALLFAGRGGPRLPWVFVFGVLAALVLRELELLERPGGDQECLSWLAGCRGLSCWRGVEW